MDQTIQLNMTQKVIGGAIMGLLAWTAWTVQDTSLKVAVLDAKVEGSIDLQKRVTTIESDIAAQHERMNGFASRIAALEARERE